MPDTSSLDRARVVAESPVFIGGLPRSGTTLMRALIGSHPELAVFPEELPLWRGFFVRYRDADLNRPEIRRRLVTELVEHPNVVRMGMRVDIERMLAALPPGPALTLGDVFAYLPRLHAAEAGRPRWGVKDPRNEFYADAIFDFFPRARMVQMVRDPRDLTVSLRGRNHPSRPHIASVVNSWRLSVDLARRNRARYGEAYLAVRYEDVVVRPEETVRRACAALGIAYRPEMLAMEGQPGWEGSNSSFDDVRPEDRSISHQAMGRHVSRLSVAETWYLQARLRRELEAWGYAARPLRLTSRDRARVATWMGEEIAWRTLRRIGVWRPIARRLGRPSEWH